MQAVNSDFTLRGLWLIKAATNYLHVAESSSLLHLLQLAQQGAEVAYVHTALVQRRGQGRAIHRHCCVVETVLQLYHTHTHTQDSRLTTDIILNLQTLDLNIIFYSPQLESDWTVEKQLRPTTTVSVSEPPQHTQRGNGRLQQRTTVKSFL